MRQRDPSHSIKFSRSPNDIDRRGGWKVEAPLRRTLIVLDGDDHAVRQVSKVLSGACLITHVRNSRSAIAMIESDPHIGAIITEQVMRSGDGVQLLETVRTLRPQVRRIILTTYTDLATIIQGLHSGAIQTLVQKPIVDSELLAAVCPELARVDALPRRASA